MTGVSPKWTSTRGADPHGVPFATALLRGLAPDGGLYVPLSVAAAGAGRGERDEFAAVAAGVLSPWLADSFPGGEGEMAVRDALSFPVPVVELGGSGWGDIHVVELFHGPTLSFKDFGARTMARLFAALQRSGESEGATVFVATSGDTGSAVADGFAGLRGVRVVLLYPEGQVSPVQERQLIARRDGVTVLRVSGTFDDCQRMVKGAFADPRFDDCRPTSANSINVGRLLPQTTYYHWAAQSVKGAPVVVVPSGNLGNISAGVLAHRSGLDVRGFVAAHNANRGFPDYLDGGAVPDRESVRTLSNAMDVGAPSNFERLTWMVGETGLKSLVHGASLDDAQTLASIRRVHAATGYTADPHTAVGLEVARRLRSKGEKAPLLVMATAHPAKFPEVMATALGSEPAEPERLASLRGAAGHAIPCGPDLDDMLQAMETDGSDTES